MSFIMNEAQALEHTMQLLNLRAVGSTNRANSPRRASDTRMPTKKTAAPVQPKRAQSIASTLDLSMLKGRKQVGGKPGIMEELRSLVKPRTKVTEEEPKSAKRGSEAMPSKPKRVVSRPSLLSSISILEDEESFFVACDKQEVPDSESEASDSETESEASDSEYEFEASDLDSDSSSLNTLDSDSSSLNTNSVFSDSEDEVLTRRRANSSSSLRARPASVSPLPRNDNSPKQPTRCVSKPGLMHLLPNGPGLHDGEVSQKNHAAPVRPPRRRKLSRSETPPLGMSMPVRPGTPLTPHAA